MNPDQRQTLQQAVAEANAGRVRKAAALLAPYTDGAEADVRLLRLAGLLAHRRGELSQAAHLFERALTDDPDDAETRFNLGVIYQVRGELQPAIEAFKRVQAACPGHTGAAVNLAQVLLKAKRYAEAGTALAAAIDLKPDEAWLHASLAALLSTDRDPEVLRRAQASATRALGLNPEHAGAYDTLGIVSMKLGEPAQAVAAAEKAIQLQPRTPEFALHLAEYLINAGRLPDAERMLREAVNRCREICELERQLGVVLLRRGNGAEALVHLEQSLRETPGDQRALAHQAVALQTLGRHGEADALLGLDRFMRQSRLADLAPFENMADFNRAFANDIRHHPSLRFEPVGLAARGGSLTGELLEAPTGSIRVFERNLRAAIDNLRTELEADPSHPFLRAIPRRYKLNTWATVVPAQGEISSHIHEESWLSGAYYVTLPGAMGDGDPERAGWIEFGRPSAELPQVAERNLRWIKPEEGLLLLFPSYWFHRTLPFQGAGERISVSFDVEAV